MGSLEHADTFAGDPDGFGRLWTPHRMAYIEGGMKRAAAGQECPFCQGPTRVDEQSLIVHRAETVFVVLNLFPYSSGHLLVCPYRHVADYTELTADETRELSEETARAMRVLRQVFDPLGFNLGMNQGRVAGAGIAAHLHQHVVPRWTGDSNFFPIIAKTRAMPRLLGDTRRLLADAWGSR
jgi:ATP adenylyltransferase